MSFSWKECKVYWKRMGKKQCFTLVCQPYILMTHSMEATNLGNSYTWYLIMRWIFLLVSECLSNLRVSVLFLMHSLQAVMNLITVICFWSNNYMIVVYRFCRKWSKSTLYIALTCLMSEAPHYIHTHVHQTSMHKIKASFIHIPLPSQMLYFTNIE